MFNDISLGEKQSRALDVDMRIQSAYSTVLRRCDGVYTLAFYEVTMGSVAFNGRWVYRRQTTSDDVICNTSKAAECHSHI